MQQHRVEPQADERPGALAHFGADGKEEPALTFQRPRCGAPAPGTFVFPRQRLQGSRDALKECLYHRAPGIPEQPGDRRRRDAALDLLDVAHPRGQLFGGWPGVLEQVSENRASRSDRLCAVQGVWKERICERRGCGNEAGLVSDAPVGHPRIDRIADEVAPRGIVELGREVEIRIVDDRGFTASPDLPEHLADDGRLAGSGVPGQEKVTGFVTADDPDDRRLGFCLP